MEEFNVWAAMIDACRGSSRRRLTVVMEGYQLSRGKVGVAAFALQTKGGVDFLPWRAAITKASSHFQRLVKSSPKPTSMKAIAR
jgi:hypothetical protein